MLDGLMNPQQPIDFPQAREQLFILTGIKPKQTEGRVSALTHGEHLRFIFTEQGKDYFRVKALLKLLGITHQADLFKNIGDKEKKETVLEYYITVAKQNFAALQQYFLPRNILKFRRLSDQFKIHDLNPSLQSALIEILFEQQFYEGLKIRNNNRYSLDGLMYYFAQLTTNSMPCFKHLQRSEIIADFDIKRSAAITFAYEVQRERKTIKPSSTQTMPIHPRRAFYPT